LSHRDRPAICRPALCDASADRDGITGYREASPNDLAAGQHAAGDINGVSAQRAFAARRRQSYNEASRPGDCQFAMFHNFCFPLSAFCFLFSGVPRWRERYRVFTHRDHDLSRNRRKKKTDQGKNERFLPFFFKKKPTEVKNS
jgi:hypothetical protein